MENLFAPTFTANEFMGFTANGFACVASGAVAGTGAAAGALTANAFAFGAFTAKALTAAGALIANAFAAGFFTANAFTGAGAATGATEMGAVDTSETGAVDTSETAGAAGASGTFSSFVGSGAASKVKQ